MKNETQIRMCPFCGHHGQKLKYFTYDGIHKEDEGSACEKVTRTIYFIKCECCGAQGPHEFEPRYAIESWNHTYDEPAHSEDPLMREFIYESNKESEEQS